MSYYYYYQKPPVAPPFIAKNKTELMKFTCAKVEPMSKQYLKSRQAAKLELPSD